MKWQETYLICFGIGTLWSIASLLLGGMHAGHGGHHGHMHFGHSHHGHAGHGQGHSAHGWASWLGAMLTPGGLAVFLAWFGGLGYILTRHTALGHWAALAMALVAGCAGAASLGAFMQWLLSHEKPLEMTDTEMVGQFGRVSSRVRAEGVGEMIFVRDGVRRAVPVRSESGMEIEHDEEVVVTRFEKGIAFVRTWEALTQPEAESERPERLAKGD